MKFTFTIIILLGALVLGSCTKNADTTTATTTTTASYQGAGSRWTADFTNGNFVIKKFADATATTALVTVNGTYIDYSNRFKKLTVTTATGTGAPTAGSEAFGIEIPGFAFILKPAGDANSEPIAMVVAGSCPTTGFSANWIATDFEAGTNTGDTQDAFGTATFTISGASSSAVITRKTFVTASPLSDSSLNFDSTNCSGGVLDAGGGVSMYLTTSGGALVSTSASKIFAAPNQGVDFTQAAAAGTYSGVAFVADATEKQIPVKIIIPSSGNGSGAQITDLATDAVAADSLVFSNFAAIASTNGLFRANATLGSDTGSINCAIFSYGGVNVIGCNGFFKTDAGDYDSDANTTEKIPFFVIARSR
jgi:hypothetical protein